MPALVLFHRRTIFGGDDLQPTSIITIVVRVVQITLLCIPILHYTISHLVSIIQQQQTNDRYNNDNDDALVGDPLSFLLLLSSIRKTLIVNNIVATAMYDDQTDEQTQDLDHKMLTSWKMFYIVLSVWCSGTILYNIVSIVLERTIMVWSSYGTPTLHIQVRSYHIQRLLYLKLIPMTILLFLLTCVALLGIVVYYIIPQHYRTDHHYHSNNSSSTPSTSTLLLLLSLYDDRTTDTNVGTSFPHADEPIRTNLWWVAVIVLLLAQLMEVFVSILFTYQLYQLPPIRASGSEATSSSSSSMFPVASERMIMNHGSSDIANDAVMAQMNYNHELVEEMWAERCAATCHCLSVSTCYMFGGRNLVDVVSTAGRSATNGGTATPSSSHSIFVDVARALADFLESRGVLDVVPSDIVSGLILLQRIQRQRIYNARQQYKTSGNGVQTTNHYHDDFMAHMPIERVESGILDNNEQSNIDLATNAKPSSILQSETIQTIRKRSSSKSLLLPQKSEQGAQLGRNRSRSKSPNQDLLLPTEPCSISRISDSQIVPREDATAEQQETATIGAVRNHRQNDRPVHSYYRMNATGSGYEREERALLNRDNFTEIYLLDEAARYAKYALAIYTWVLYLYEHPLTGPFRLLLPIYSTLCCKDCRSRRSYEQPSLDPQFMSDGASPNASLMSFIDENGHIEGDNICQTHKHAILLTAGLQEADLVYVQLRSSLSDIPYCILLDHAWKSIVVSIRGTFSIEDCITDVLITPESLEKLGFDFGFDAIDEYCHGGVMSCARNVYRDLERHGILDKLLVGDDAKYSGYTLRLVGHSLGAATSTLLSYMLKQKFPSLRCINYSPPGCTFTWKVATQCKEWCTSCVLDSDLVPRLKVESIERLRDEILDLIARIKVPKAVVAQRFTEKTFQLCNDDYDKDGVYDDDLADVLYDPEEVPETEYHQQLIRFKEIQDERRRQRGAARSIQLYPPGRILHLIKTGEKRSCSAGLAKVITCCTTNIGSTYIPVWVDNDDLNEILVGPRMGTDHFPNRIRAILDEVATTFVR